MAVEGPAATRLQLVRHRACAGAGLGAGDAFQRIQTYTLNSITKKIVTVLLRIVGLVMTGTRS